MIPQMKPELAQIFALRRLSCKTDAPCGRTPSHWQARWPSRGRAYQASEYFRCWHEAADPGCRLCGR